MENIKVNVTVNNRRTTVTINTHILELCSALGMDGMTPQSLIDDAELSGYVHVGNVSSWVTSLIAVEAMNRIKEPFKSGKREPCRCGMCWG